jgi:glycine cleavage system H protein
MWCRAEGTRCRFGFTAYAVRLMQDVYFLDWVISAGDVVHHLEQIGHIETSKAVADLFAPMAGTLVEFNRELLKDPSAINVDKYGAGWLFEMEGDPRSMKSVADYHQFLTDNWEKTQRLIEGKMNLED